MRKIRIGAGAGTETDRLWPALELMERGNLDYISFECMAERTTALAQQRKIENPKTGYNRLLEYRMEKVIPLGVAPTGIRFVLSFVSLSISAISRLNQFDTAVTEPPGFCIITFGMVPPVCTDVLYSRFSRSKT